MRPSFLATLVLIAAVGGVQPAAAQSGKNDAAARLAEQVRRLTDAQQKLQRENARLTESQTKSDEAIRSAQSAQQAAERERGAERDRTTALRRDLQARDGRLAEQERAAEALRREAEAVRARAAELEGALAQSRERAQALEAQVRDRDASLQVAQGTQRETALRLGQCVERNDRMASLSQELLSAVESSAHAEVLLGTEPFSGFKRVRIRTLIQDWRDRIDDQRVNDALAAPRGRVDAGRTIANDQPR